MKTTPHHRAQQARSSNDNPHGTTTQLDQTSQQTMPRHIIVSLFDVMTSRSQTVAVDSRATLRQ
eukprot:7670848-Prorocentrum_lima.AAC.1